MGEKGTDPSKEKISRWVFCTLVITAHRHSRTIFIMNMPKCRQIKDQDFAEQNAIREEVSWPGKEKVVSNRNDRTLIEASLVSSTLMRNPFLSYIVSQSIAHNTQVSLPDNHQLLDIIVT